jgi:hypothetical protein
VCLNEMYAKVCLGRHLFANFHTQNALLQLLLNFAFSYDIRKVQLQLQVGLKLNGTHQLLAYADDVNLLCGNIDTRKKT